jgi:hypothetical protein
MLTPKVTEIRRAAYSNPDAARPAATSAPAKS